MAAPTTRPPTRAPLRVTLVVLLVASVALALLGTGSAVTTALRGYLVAEVDQDLADVAARPPQPGDFGGQGDSPFDTPRDEYVGIATVTGELQREAVSNPGVPLPDLDPARLAGAGDAPFTVGSRQGALSWRVVVQPVSFGGTPALLVRGISLADVQQTVRRLVVAELLVGLLTLGVVGAAAYLLVRRSLRPLEEVEETAAAIAAGDLTRRVPDADDRTEVGRLAGALNGMLAQLEAAFGERERSVAAARAGEERMRRFVADASHELRTPLTSIRGYAELFRQGAARDPEELARLLRRVEDEAARMGLLVEDLLLLARLDQQRPLQQRPVDLLTVVSDAASDLRAVAPDRQVDVDVRGGPRPLVLGDEARLRQVVANLTANARTHTPAGSPVALTLDTTAGERGSPGLVRLAVHDRGAGLGAEERDRVFERFYRADPARTRAAGGAGLGLSIVAALVAAHGGRVTVESTPGRGSTFAVDLPLLDDGGHVDDRQEPAETDDGRIGSQA